LHDLVAGRLEDASKVITRGWILVCDQYRTGARRDRRQPPSPAAGTSAYVLLHQARWGKYLGKFPRKKSGESLDSPSSNSGKHDIEGGCTFTSKV
jgi:hypothetical protein